MINDCIKSVRRSLYNSSIPELLHIAEVCGFDDIETTIAVDGFIYRKSNVQIGLKIGMCQDAVAKRKRRIVERVYQYRLFMLHQEGRVKVNTN